MHLLRVLVVNKTEDNQCKVDWELERMRQHTGMLSLLSETGNSRDGVDDKVCIHLQLVYNTL